MFTLLVLMVRRRRAVVCADGGRPTSATAGDGGVEQEEEEVGYGHESNAGHDRFKLQTAASVVVIGRIDVLDDRLPVTGTADAAVPLGHGVLAVVRRRSVRLRTEAMLRIVRRFNASRRAQYQQPAQEADTPVRVHGAVDGYACAAYCTY